MSLRLIARAAGRHPSGSIVLALWLLLVSGTPAFAAALELIPPAEGDYRAGEAIAFDVSQLPDEVAPRLALEIDDVNVTEFVRREGNQAILDLPVPLEAGLRNIRVVDYQPDGTIEEIGFWTIEVAAASAIQSAELAADATVGFDFRAADHNLALQSPFSDVPGRTLLWGALDAQGRVVGDGWQVDGRVPVLFRDDFQTQSGQPWDLGDYRVRAEAGRFSAELGHQAPPSSLISEGFHRRGASVGLAVPELRTDIQAFALRSDPISGFEESLGVHDADERVVGVTTQSNLFDDGRHSASLQTTYLRGRRQGFGVVEAGFGSPESGTAWSVVGDVHLFERRVQLRGEYARSLFNGNTAIPGKPIRDDAFSALLGLRPLGHGLELAGRYVDWELVFELDELGANFDSPASLFPDNDRRRQRAYSRLSVDTWSFTVDYVRTRYNAERRPSEPTFMDESLQMYTSWSPTLSPENLFRRWLGSPYIELEYGRQSLKPIREPDPNLLLLNGLIGGIFLPVYADQLQRSSGLRFGASTDGGVSWSFGYLLQRSIDRTGFDANTRTNGLSASLNLALAPNASVGMSLQRDRIKDERFRLQTVSWTGTIYSYWEPSDRWVAAMNASIFRSRDTNSTFDTRVITVAPSLTWRAILPKPNRPGLNFTVDGTWQHNADDVNLFLTDDVFQVFLKAELNLPIRFGRGA